MRRRRLAWLLIAAAIVLATTASRGYRGGALKSLVPALRMIPGH